MADHRTDSVDIILLAAGCSRRFGPENKLLQPFMGKPVIEWALELAVAVQGHGRVLVVYSDAAVRGTAARFPVELLPNRHPDRGRVES
ncbi:MAG: NTP transferase domain-containing protein, partial [Planctomycetes bacterium]|nr:NTP transferase domain-containing protein [Planctomycetota bacterium]